MDRALIAAALASAATSAHAAPAGALQLGLGDGIGHASRAGTYRDDAMLELRGLVRFTPRVAGEAAFVEDLERIEPSFALGARVEIAPIYVRAALALVGATHLGSNVDLYAGTGYLGAIADHLAWFAEADLIERLGDVTTTSLRVQAGVALTF